MASSPAASASGAPHANSAWRRGVNILKSGDLSDEAGGLEKAMEMDDKISRLRAVDGSLRLAAPGALRARIIGKYADHVDFRRIAKFIRVEALQFAAENQMQELLGFLGSRFGISGMIGGLRHGDFLSRCEIFVIPTAVRARYNSGALAACIPHASEAPMARRPAARNGSIIPAEAPNKTPWRVSALL